MQRNGGILSENSLAMSQMVARNLMLFLINLRMETRWLANKINTFDQRVSSDFPKPNSDTFPGRDESEPIPVKCIIPVLEVENQLMKLDTAKVPGPDNSCSRSGKTINETGYVKSAWV